MKTHWEGEEVFKIVRAKLHGIRVTGCALNYHGSITLDPLHCKTAGILPLEFVDIWNKNSGRRLSTYVIYGDAGSRCCVLNGAAARTCQEGDELIICASEYIASQAELRVRRPVVLCFNGQNEVSDALRYVVSDDGQGGCDFAIVRDNPS